MNINHNHVLSLLQEGFTTIHVTFEADFDSDTDAIVRARNRNNKVRTYTYKALLKDKIKVGDTVVVDSPTDGLCVVQVVAVDEKPKIELDAPFSYKWIVQKVDTTVYDDLLRQEDEFRQALVEVERIKQREAVMKSFHEVLPADSEARKLFDQTLERAKSLPNAG